jgi:hypothetical protein
MAHLCYALAAGDAKDLAGNVAAVAIIGSWLHLLNSAGRLRLAGERRSRILMVGYCIEKLSVMLASL